MQVYHLTYLLLLNSITPPPLYWTPIKSKFVRRSSNKYLSVYKFKCTRIHGEKSTRYIHTDACVIYIYVHVSQLIISLKGASFFSLWTQKSPSIWLAYVIQDEKKPTTKIHMIKMIIHQHFHWGWKSCTCNCILFIDLHL